MSVKVKEMPIEFLQDVVLICQFEATFKPKYMAWVRIPHGQNLATKDISSNRTKYEIEMSQKEAVVQYELKIKDFDLSDVNNVYRCDLDFKSYSMQLLLNEKEFVGIGKISKFIDFVNEELVVNVNIPDVYPDAECTVTFEDENLTRSLDVIKSKKGLFYDIQLTLHFETDKCSGKVLINCVIGERVKPIYVDVQRDNCQSYYYLIIVPVILFLAVIIVCGFLRRKKRRKQSKATAKCAYHLQEYAEQVVDPHRHEKSGIKRHKHLHEPTVLLNEIHEFASFILEDNDADKDQAEKCMHYRGTKQPT